MYNLEVQGAHNYFVGRAMSSFTTKMSSMPTSMVQPAKLCAGCDLTRYAARPTAPHLDRFGSTRVHTSFLREHHGRPTDSSQACSAASIEKVCV